MGPLIMVRGKPAYNRGNRLELESHLVVKRKYCVRKKKKKRGCF